MKRDEATATTIAKEVVADAANLMTQNSDGWVFYTDAKFTAGGNWSPLEFRAPKPTVDFMWAKADPRLRLFYKKNNYTQANMDLAIAAARNYRLLRSRGHTVRKTIDCLIATFCLETGNSLLHRDHDFDSFEKYLGLLVIHP